MSGHSQCGSSPGAHQLRSPPPAGTNGSQVMGNALKHLPIPQRVLPGPYTPGAAPVLGTPSAPRPPWLCISAPSPGGSPTTMGFLYAALSNLLPRDATGDHWLARENQAGIVLYSFYCFFYGVTTIYVRRRKISPPKKIPFGYLQCRNITVKTADVLTRSDW